ncbi:MAG: 2,5-diamino-6-(ribosylamino)-4(3H)-pyrimidinone 5'-phosphate reductase [Methanolobus sp.]|uniref:2,5-diamino-6-(ribosylamino)-4(3H)-pyrimidinone 5'-phosphate reductase n=1 Tax=Methanolobus sp. TaxID=1874737 RepID=UPI0027300B25|nr:2,5-diamino-6-(ribosylamino)-4(3H)-pyrimidinone 5'-phosphate reductase [Methanolobus sp.]MDP2217526.1 2,5-diamino-6-(ribosylamino)-4(3H)-pyrimidinone 5'-phosphate reductase [Methanolobus sp.]
MGRPFIFINSAMSADGKISTKQRKQVRISGKEDFDRMDALRASSDAIMVGIGTLLADNPGLTVKSPERRIERKEAGLEENPARIVVDSKARIPLDSDIFIKGEGKRIIVVSSSAPADRMERLREKATIVSAGDSEVDLAAAVEILHEMGINRLMVEGGATLNWGLLSGGLVDEIYTFVGNLIIGGKTAPTFADGNGFLEKDILKLELIDAARMEEGVLLRWKVLSGK